MLVTTSWFMAETRTNTMPHSTKRSADFTSPASPSIRRNASSTSQASSSSGTYSLQMVSLPHLRKLKRFKTRLNLEVRLSCVPFSAWPSTPPVSSGALPPSRNPFTSSHAVTQPGNGSNRRLMRSTASRQRSLHAATAMPYFSPYKETKILVDASPVGNAGILVQDDQPIVYGSRALSDVESRYSQTEREALAVVWACEHFDIYVRGSSFTVVTDHKPLVHIWSKPRPPLRIARWSLTIVFRPGKDNPADYMPRNPATKDVRSSRAEKIAEEYVEFISQTSVPNAITLEEVRAATAKDKVFQTVIELCNTGSCHEVNKYDVDQAALRQFQNVRDELTVNRHGNLLLRNTRIVMPTSLQARAVQLAHEGHQGTSKTKALIRSNVWFPGLDTAVDDAIRRCIPCQANTTRQNREPLNMSNLPLGPWINLSIDFCGPLPSGQYLMVITNEYSRFPIVEVVRSTAAEQVSQVVDKVFCTYDPDVVKTDNGPPFNSQVWKGFLKTCGIKNRKITPLWPKANGQV